MISPLIKAFIFDMDGTLIHNMEYHQLAFFEFLKRHTISITEAEYEQKNKGTITEIIPRFFGDHLSHEQITELGEEKETLYREMYRPHLKPIEGLIEFLEEAKNKGIRIALATMGDQKNVQFTLAGLRIQHYFDAIVSGEEVKQGKPHPEVFQSAAAKLSVSPDHCLAFEDSVSGITAALAANMQVVGIATTHTPEELRALFQLPTIIKTYTELHW
ncbi:HAD family phosphatase [Xanthocytophaga agilis]|uniref:HAD family phosphatase n=1 Tax=Xanthocytophaga agilis TaxID=3048010 RepID=A0AAE3R9N9_9BACT|nr:HAD family phosphatase [Xanthocytophaga agilis]MDJ1506211.1 HAD family phosphatase [Xanthocytophaga agilis]